MEQIINLSNRNYKLDLTNRRITFLDSRWYFTEDGNPVPSVTTILDAYPKTAAFYEWLKRMGSDADDVRDEAGRKGSRVHALTELYDKGEEVSLLNETGDINMSLNEWGMFSKYVEFRERFPFEIQLLEQTIVSSVLGFAGTLDRVIVTPEGKKILLDIKTSNTIYPHYWLQLAAYEKLLTEMYGFNPVDEVGIVWLNAKTKTDGKKGSMQGVGWQMILKDENDKDWELFQATQKLWLAENEGSKPRQLVYQLNFKKPVKEEIIS